jgi:hypothetical protein
MVATKFRKLLSSVKVVFICTAIGALFAILISILFPYFTYGKQMLPAAPVSIEGILAVDLGGFYEAQLASLGSDNHVYVYTIMGTSGSWAEGSIPKNSYGFDCSKRSLRRLRGVGEIVQCVEFTTVGEWCPSNIESIALNSKGELWNLSSMQPCPLVMIPFAFITGCIGFIIGVALMLIRKPSNHPVGVNLSKDAG